MTVLCEASLCMRPMLPGPRPLHTSARSPISTPTFPRAEPHETLPKKAAETSPTPAPESMKIHSLTFLKTTAPLPLSASRETKRATAQEALGNDRAVAVVQLNSAPLGLVGNDTPATAAAAQLEGNAETVMAKLRRLEKRVEVLEDGKREHELAISRLTPDKLALNKIDWVRVIIRAIYGIPDIEKVNSGKMGLAVCHILTLQLGTLLKKVLVALKNKTKKKKIKFDGDTFFIQHQVVDTIGLPKIVSALEYLEPALSKEGVARRNDAVLPTATVRLLFDTGTDLVVKETEPGAKAQFVLIHEVLMARSPGDVAPDLRDRFKAIGFPF